MSEITDPVAYGQAVQMLRTVIGTPREQPVVDELRRLLADSEEVDADSFAEFMKVARNGST